MMPAHFGYRVRAQFFKVAKECLGASVGLHTTSYAIVLVNEGQAYSQLKDYKTCIALTETAINILANTTDRRTFMFSTALNNMAGAYAGLTQYEAALPLYIEAFEYRKEVLGADSPLTAQTAFSVAGVLNWMERCGYASVPVCVPLQSAVDVT